MKMHTTVAALALIVAGSAISFGASAQIYNPENDSTWVFRYQPQATPTPKPEAATPVVGQVSADGLYVYSGSDRGLVNRQHSYTLRGGAFVHTGDCLPYNLPAPVAAMPQLQKGVFADKGA